MDLGHRDRVVVITGASGGIGRELVATFAAEGARVVVHCHSQREAAEKIAAGLGDQAMVVPADLSNEADVENLFTTVESRWGGVHTLVANAGVWPPESIPIHEMKLSQWEETISTDLTSVFLSMRRFFRGIIQYEIPDPCGILIGSTAAVFGEAGHVDYSAAKAGLTYGMTATLKNEISKISPRGRVNTICPGWTITPMVEKFSGQEEAIVRAKQTVAMKKFATPADIASAAAFLSSPVRAGHITGERMVVSGGMEGRVLNESEACSATLP